MTVAEVAHLLRKEYGRRIWCRRAGPLSELVGTVLSQNTSDTNSHRAFASLHRRFGGWEEVARAEVGEIAQAIKGGGLGQVKAVRIKEILRRILEERGSLDLSFLGEMPLPEARAWLRRLPGVGPKTAACVLLFSLGRPALPVDTHVHRLAHRLGLIDSSVSAERAHEVLGALVPPEDVYQLHLDLVEHGRRVCRAQHPLCDRCVLNLGCPCPLAGTPPRERKVPAHS